jgi:NADH-quinone oxidoreductase subunit J
MIAFWLLSIGLVVTSVLTVTARRPVHSVVYLIANFVMLAMLYVTLSAEFLAVIQVIVYASAILMLFVFVMALLSTSTGPFSVGPDRLPRFAVPSVALVVVVLGLIVYGVSRTPAAIVPKAGVASGPAGTANVFGSAADFGAALMTTYLLPFEVTAVVLMVAVIGVVMLAGDAAPSATLGHHARRRRGPRVREPIAKARRPVEKGSAR